jgi:iron complex outermembrane receptor protein
MYNNEALDVRSPKLPLALTIPFGVLATGPACAADSASSFISVEAPMAEDQEILNVPQTSSQAPSLLAKTNTGVPLAVRLFLHQPVPDATNFFTETGVGTYVDGVYFGRSYGALYDFIDIDQIDVIPSAQGSLFGRNTVDGAVIINTRQPGNKFAATGDITYGSYNWLDVRGAVSGPIADDKLAASFSGLIRRRDGLMDATILGKDVNDRDYQAGRVKLLFTPIDAYDVTLSIDALRDRSSPKYPTALSPFAPGQDPAAKPGRDLFTTEAVTPELNRVDEEGIAIVQNWRPGDVTIKSITAYRDIASTSYVTYDATPANTLGTESFVHQNRLTEDLSASGGWGPLEGTIGAFYLRKDTKQTTPTGGSPNFSRELDNAYAGYGQLTWKLSDDVQIVAGTRYSVEDKRFSSDFYAGNKKATLFGKSKPIPAGALVPQSDSDTWYGFTPKAGVDFQITPDLLAYFSYTKGFKSGGWNNRLPPNYNAEGQLVVAPVRFLAESATEYEVGLKAAFFDQKVHVNLAAYIHDYANLQIPVLLYNASTYWLTTAPTAEISGIEIDPTWQITRELQLYSLITLQHGSYGPGFFCQNPAGTNVDCSANKLVGLAPLRALVGVVYAPDLPIPGKLRFSLSVNYSDKYENSVAGVDLAATTSHSLLDASVNYALPDGHWSFSVEGRNLTDVRWFSTAAQDGPAVAVYPDDPLTIVARARYKY